MISQKCPRCNSNRVRRGYRHTPWWSRLIGRYYLLCDNCNWEFTGFAVPGTTSSKPTPRPRRKSGSSAEDSESGPLREENMTEREDETASSRRSGAAMLF